MSALVRTVPYITGHEGWAAGSTSGPDGTGEFLTVWGSAYDSRLLYRDQADARDRAEQLRADAHDPAAIVVRRVRVTYHSGVTMDGIAFRILPDPAAETPAADS